MCKCFFQDLQKLKKENLGLLPRLFEGDKAAEAEVKEIISAETEFGVSLESSCFRVVEKNVEVVHICKSCLEKFLLALDIELLPPLEWWNHYQTFKRKKMTLENSKLWDITHEESCVALFLKKEKNISDICDLCGNFILNRTPQHVLFSIDVDF